MPEPAPFFYEYTLKVHPHNVQMVCNDLADHGLSVLQIVVVGEFREILSVGQK